MEITCTQMDVLLSFYIEGDLSKALKQRVEEHLRKCPSCRAKYDIVKSMLADLNQSINNDKADVVSVNSSISQQYRMFQNNLSAYVDNELPPEENIKIKKFTINNKKARKELEDTYNIRKIMSDSFKRSKSNSKSDFSRQVMKQLDLSEENSLAFHPVLKYIFAFVMTVLALSAFIIFSLTLS